MTKVLASMPVTAAQALRDRLEVAVREYETPNGLEFPGVSLLAFATR